MSHSVRLASRIGLLMAWLTVLCGADAAEPGTERFSMSLGVFGANRNTDTRLDSETSGRGTAINLEKALGLDSTQTEFRIDGQYKFTQRHKFDFSVFELSRSASRPISETITFGDTVFAFGSTVESDNRYTIYKLGYNYSFLVTDRGSFGAGAGLHVARIKTQLSEPNLGERESSNLRAPLPVVGVRGEYRIRPLLTLRGSADLFALDVGDVAGRLVDLYVGVDYQFHERFAAGVAYNSVAFDLDIVGNNSSGALDWDYDGVVVYFKLNFGSFEVSP